MKTLTIHDFITELQSFITIDKDTLTKAKASEATIENSDELYELYMLWCHGTYDEDLELLIQRLIMILDH